MRSRIYRRGLQGLTAQDLAALLIDRLGELDAPRFGHERPDRLGAADRQWHHCGGSPFDANPWRQRHHDCVYQRPGRQMDEEDDVTHGCIENLEIGEVGIRDRQQRKPDNQQVPVRQ